MCRLVLRAAASGLQRPCGRGGIEAASRWHAPDGNTAAPCTSACAARTHAVMRQQQQHHSSQLHAAATAASQRPAACGSNSSSSTAASCMRQQQQQQHSSQLYAAATAASQQPARRLSPMPYALCAHLHSVAGKVARCQERWYSPDRNTLWCSSRGKRWLQHQLKAMTPAL